MPIQIQKNNIKVMWQNKKILKMYCQKHMLYSSGTQVTYSLDTDSSRTYEIDEGESYVNQPFDPVNSNYPIFLGWKDSTDPNEPVLTEEETIVTSDTPIATYALFAKPITVKYCKNGASEENSSDGDIVEDTKYEYYNNGQKQNALFIVKKSPFTKTGYGFSKWTDASGNEYKPGNEVSFFVPQIQLFANWLPAVSGNLAGNSKYVSLNPGAGKNGTSSWSGPGSDGYYNIGTTAVVNSSSVGNNSPNWANASISIYLNEYKRAVVTLQPRTINTEPWWKSNGRYGQVTINGSMVVNSRNENNNETDRTYTLTGNGTISIYCYANVDNNNNGNYTYVIADCVLKSVIFYMD